MAGISKFKTAKNKVVGCRIEEEVYEKIKNEHGNVSTYIVNLLYSQPQFKDRHPDEVKKDQIREQIKRLEKQLKGK